MKTRESGCSQETAAAKAGISVRSGRRIEQGQHQPQRGRPHDWRTRKDPLAEVWESELVPLLARQPNLQATSLLEYLQEHYGERYGVSVLRTLQRRVQQWKATSGPAKTVVFDLEHHPGEMGLSDFTHFKQGEITIQGQALRYLFYHYRLAYSGWQYVQVIQGGESFVALSEGLQNALWQCGGSPREHRTDSLSAAYRNLGKRTPNDLTQFYENLCAHYQLKPTRNNRGIAHENGAIEASHGHFKNRLHQALLLRGSFDFDSVPEYQEFVEQVVSRLNRGCQERFEQERAHLQSLPRYRHADYEAISAKVSTRSAIQVRCITYTVPSQLIGRRILIHLHHDRLVGFLGHQEVFELPRLYVPPKNPKRRARCVNYRHVIDSLRLKPRAFLHCSWQQELLPDDNYRQLWQQMSQDFERYSAARMMTEALYLAAQLDKEQAVAQYLQQHLDAGTLTLAGLQAHFGVPSSVKLPALALHQHQLSDYDGLLNQGSDSNPSYRNPDTAAQILASALHEATVAGVGETSGATGLELRSVSPGSVRTRNDPTLPGSHPTCPQGGSPASRQNLFQF